MRKIRHPMTAACNASLAKNRFADNRLSEAIVATPLDDESSVNAGWSMKFRNQYALVTKRRNLSSRLDLKAIITSKIMEINITMKRYVISSSGSRKICQDCEKFFASFFL